MKRVTTIGNNTPMIINGRYCWEILNETNGSEVFRMHLGTKNSNIITLLYGDNVFSIRMFDTTYTGNGDVFYFKIPFDKVEYIVEALLEAHDLKLLPIYDISTIKYIGILNSVENKE